MISRNLISKPIKVNLLASLIVNKTTEFKWYDSVTKLVSCSDKLIQCNEDLILCI